MPLTISHSAGGAKGVSPAREGWEIGKREQAPVGAAQGCVLREAKRRDVSPLRASKMVLPATQGLRPGLTPFAPPALPCLRIDGMARPTQSGQYFRHPELIRPTQKDRTLHLSVGPGPAAMAGGPFMIVMKLSRFAGVSVAGASGSPAAPAAGVRVRRRNPEGAEQVEGSHLLNEYSASSTWRVLP
jgi:hypothetical protein